MFTQLFAALALAATAICQITVPVGYYPAIISTEWNANNVLQPVTPVKTGSALVIWGVTKKPEQTWLLKDGATKIQLNGTNLCIDAGTGRSNGSPLTVANCTENLASQNWNFNKDRQLILANTNLCADLYAGSLTNGTKIVIWGCIAGDKNHIWKVANLTAKPV